MSSCSGSAKGSGSWAEDEAGGRKVGVYIITVPSRDEERRVESREKRVDSNLDWVCVSTEAGAPWGSLLYSKSS